jgi:hypothetical protein
LALLQLSDELKQKVGPIRDAVRESQKAREDRTKIRRRTHKGPKTPAAPGSANGDAESGSVTPMEVDKVEDEATIRKREAEKVQELVKQTVGEQEMQPGTNWSGLYELSGEWGTWMPCRGCADTVINSSYCHPQRTVR